MARKATRTKWRLDNSGLGDGLCALRLNARAAIAKACAEGEAHKLAPMTLPDSASELAAWEEAKGTENYHLLCEMAGIPTSRNGLDNAYLPKSNQVAHWHDLCGSKPVVKYSGFRDSFEEAAMIEICRRADLELHLDESGIRRSTPTVRKALSKGAASSIINAIALGTSVRLGERGIDGADYYEARNEAHRLLAQKSEKSIGHTSRAAIIAAIG